MAFSHLHRHGILHRNISSQNIFIDHNDTVKIACFDLALHQVFPALDRPSNTDQSHQEFLLFTSLPNRYNFRGCILSSQIYLQSALSFTNFILASCLTKASKENKSYKITWLQANCLKKRDFEAISVKYVYFTVFSDAMPKCQT